MKRGEGYNKNGAFLGEPSGQELVEEDRLRTEEFFEEISGMHAADDYVPDGVKLYLSEISRYPLLTACEEVALAKIIEEGGPDSKAAHERMINCNLRLVVSMAKRQVGRGLELMDLIQEGNIGLMKAIEKYDYRLGYKFSTYASWWIRQCLSRALSSQGNTIRLPVHVAEGVNRLKREEAVLTGELQRQPTDEELGSRLGVDKAKVIQMRSFNRTVISLDTPVGDDGEATVGDFVEDEDAYDPEKVAMDRAVKEGIEQALMTLNPREREVLVLRFGLESGEAKTLDQCGKLLGVTRERIRQIEVRALEKLRQSGRCKILRDLSA